MIENNLVNMEVVQKLESMYLNCLKDVVEDNDINQIANLSMVSELIKELKQNSTIINEQYDMIYNLVSDYQFKKSFDVEITEGMLNQNYLSLKPMDNSPLNNSLKPAENVDFSVVFPDPIGKVTTSYIKKSNRLKDRAHVRAFFEDFGLMPHSIITFTQIKPNAEYQIDIKQKF